MSLTHAGQRGRGSLPLDRLSILLLGLLVLSGTVLADTRTLAWDPVEGAERYELHVGEASRNYSRQEGTSVTSVTVTALVPGTTYYFAVRACRDQPTTECSLFSNEISTTISPSDADGDGLSDAQDPDDDNDGVADSQDAAPYDPSNTGTVIRLSVGTANAGQHGWGWGDRAYRTILAATFDGDGTDHILRLQGYDIDYADEVAVYVNDQLLGYLAAGPNNGLSAPGVWRLPADLLFDGENRIEIIERTSGYVWGVTGLGVYASESAGALSLAAGTTDAGQHGWGWGDGAYKTDLSATFQGDGTDRLLHLQCYDIDTADEAALYLNGNLLGYLSPGPNNALNTPSLWWLPAARLVKGENRIDVIQRTPGDVWGVTGLGLHPTGSAFGNLTTLADGDRSHGGGFELHVPHSPEGYLIELAGYDADSDDEIGVDLNGSPLVDLPVGTNNAWSAADHLVLPADWLEPGDNVIFAQNLYNTGHNWGIRFDRLLPMGAALGNLLLRDMSLADARLNDVRYLLPAMDDNVELGLAFYDVDDAVELALRQDGASLGYAKRTTPDLSWGPPESIVIPEGQRTVIEIDNTYNPGSSHYWIWGVRLEYLQ